jgi:hypothetical protein
VETLRKFDITMSEEQVRQSKVRPENAHLKDKLDTEALNEFSIRDLYYELLDRGEKGKSAVDLSIQNHVDIIVKASADFYDGIGFQSLIQDHIEHRLKQYTKCIAKSTPNYFKYLMETYNRHLRQQLRERLEDE